MRAIGRLCGIAALLLSAQLSTGCRMIEEHVAGLDAMQVEAPRRIKHRKVARLIKPKPVAAGQSLREFCGKRHVEFQAGRLVEQPEEMARNNDLCKQVYGAAPTSRTG